MSREIDKDKIENNKKRKTIIKQNKNWYNKIKKNEQKEKILKI